MGMAASQARFLGLTARRNNVEFEGQQINQQRTTLSNQSANYYNDLLGMAVPVPPSVDDFTKTVYTFSDGALTNEITSMIAQNDGTYSLSYLSKWHEDYVPVAASTNIVNVQNGVYSVGAQPLRGLGQVNATAVVGNSINIGGVTYPVTQDPNGYYIEKTTKVAGVAQCTQQDIENFEYYQFDATYGSAIQVFKDDATGEFYSVDENGVQTTLAGVTENDLVICLWDGTQTEPEYAVSLVTPNGDGTYNKEVWTDELTKEYLTQAQINSITTYSGVEDDPRLAGLTGEKIAAVMAEEAAWAEQLAQKYGTEDWAIRYIQNTSTGEFVPYFYRQSDLDNNQNNVDAYGNILTNIDCFTIGSDTKVQEVFVTGALVERDSSGRFVSINIPNLDGSGTFAEYMLTTNTVTDQDAYNDAMNRYEHEKYLYDQAIQDINAKIEIVQAQDKNLELRLKQLDTEHNAVQTEMDAVEKVIQKNTESSFKTFG